MNENASQWLGQVVDRKFELIKFVGSSPGRWVFFTEREGQKAAIKLISANHRQSDGWIWRWEQARNLSHSNLIRVYEAGRCRIQDSALIYVVVEYAEENLAEILTQRALTSAEASAMLPPVLDALAYLHGKGRVHGHVKPGNILAIGNQVKISSDGICAIGDIPGQPGAYDAPEAVKQGYSSAADVWSIGLTLVETLTRQVPPVAQNGADDPALPDCLPQPFLDIARECLQRDPKHRATIADISVRLRSPTSVPTPMIRDTARTVPKAATKVQKTQAIWRHAIPAAILVGLALVVILLAPKILNRMRGQSAADRAVRPTPHLTEPRAAPPAREPDAVPTSDSNPEFRSSANQALASPVRQRPAEPVPAATAPTKPTASSEVIEQVLPDAPQKALDTIQGTVKVGVRVQVDSSGAVMDASLNSPGPSKYFANLAIASARKWKFTSLAGGGSGAREWVLQFQFRQDGTKATLVPARR